MGRQASKKVLIIEPTVVTAAAVVIKASDSEQANNSPLLLLAQAIVALPFHAVDNAHGTPVARPNAGLTCRTRAKKVGRAGAVRGTHLVTPTTQAARHVPS